MRRARFPLATAAIGAATVIAGAAAGTGSAAEPEPTAGAAAKKTTVLLKKTPFGRVLFDGKGGALYLFTADSGRTSNCYGDCAVAWPPFYARGKFDPGPGVNPKKLGKTTRADGRKQVTYASHPLYYYVHDPKNVVGCHDVFEFGGDWLAVLKSGKPAP